MAKFSLTQIQELTWRIIFLSLFLLGPVCSAFSQIVAWGRNAAGECEVPTSLSNQSIVAVAAGWGHSIALSRTGKVTAWGDNSSGQCAIPRTLENQTVASFACGDYHNLALTSAGNVFAWGWDDYGQCDLPSDLTNQTIVQVAAGATHSLALTQTGHVIAWGDDEFMQCQVPSSLSNQTVTAITAGGYHNLALTSVGKVVAWGLNLHGECDVPASLANQTVVAIAAGSYHSLALTSAGEILAWGWNLYGQTNLPVSLNNQSVTAIAAGSVNSLALTSSGKVVAWGDNSSLQCEPPSTLANQTVTAIACGGYHNLAAYESSLTPGPVLSLSEPTGIFTGGRSATVTGTLTFVRPLVAETTVSLGSSDPAITLPTSIRIPAKSSSVAFSIASIPVAELTKVKITAIIPGYSDASINCTVKPATCTFIVSPTILEGGGSATGKVTLNVPFSSNVSVTLSSSDPHVTFGAQSIVIPANQISANFEVKCKPVATEAAVKITAKPGISAVTFMKTITLKPGATIASFTASRSVIYGNQRTVLSLRLVARPGPNGATVKLEASSPGLRIPDFAFFPAGIVLKMIDVFAEDNASASTVMVTATSGASAVGKSFAIKPLKLSNTILSTTTVKGGSSITYSATLNAPVDVETVLSLTSSDPKLLTVPPTLKVPAGTRTVTCTLTTSPVQTRKSAKISSTKGDSTIVKTLFVTP